MLLIFLAGAMFGGFVGVLALTILQVSTDR